MPIYEYACRNCAHTFEIEQRMSENSLKECPQCHQSALEKVFDSVGISFKGSGFYVTDQKRSLSTASPTSKPIQSAKDSNSSSQK